MDKEYLIKKWLDNALSETETEAFNALEDAALYEEIIKEAKRFDGALEAKVPAFDLIDRQLEHKKSPSVNWLQITLRIAAIFIVGMVVFTLLDKD